MIMANGTKVQKPPMRASDEATTKQLELAREQGQVFKKAVKEMTTEEAEGKEKRVDDYFIGYAVEEAEGMYHLHDGELKWQDPEDENVHVEVVVRDGADGRFVPGLTIYATLIDDQGQEVGTHEQPFIWHPWLHHYGRNWRVPGDGEYTLRVRIETPDFMRHDKINGKRFARPATVEFEKVKIETGQKKS
jgi:hypothetical protein